MQRYFLQAITWALLAQFGCISFCGHGLHLVAGHEHGHALVECQARCAHSQALPCHISDATDVDRDADACVGLVALPASGIVEDHDCAICTHLAQAQFAAPVPLGDSIHFCTPVAGEPALPRLVAHTGGYYGRAPPAFLLG